MWLFTKKKPIDSQVLWQTGIALNRTKDEVEEQ